jgi:hypothetical protein
MATQRIKEAAGMLDLYKSELNKSGLADHCRAVTCLEVFGASDIPAAVDALRRFETEGSLEDLRRFTIDALQRAVASNQLDQIAS